jgi:hypothetical protein
MAINFHRCVVIPLWAVAFFAVALSAPPRVMPSLIALLGIVVIGSTMPAIVGWLRTSRPWVHVLPAVVHEPPPGRLMMTASTSSRTLHEVIDANTPDTGDAADLVRMDDDGGRQMDPAGRTDGRLTDTIRGSPEHSQVRT